MGTHSRKLNPQWKLATLYFGHWSLLIPVKPALPMSRIGRNKYEHFFNMFYWCINVGAVTRCVLYTLRIHDSLCCRLVLLVESELPAF